MKREWQLAVVSRVSDRVAPSSFLQVNTRVPRVCFHQSSPLAPLHFSAASPFPPCCLWRLDLVARIPLRHFSTSHPNRQTSATLRDFPSPVMPLSFLLPPPTSSILLYLSLHPFPSWSFLSELKRAQVDFATKTQMSCQSDFLIFSSPFNLIPRFPCLFFFQFLSTLYVTVTNVLVAFIIASNFHYFLQFSY